MPTVSSEHDRYILHLNHALAMESALVDHLDKRIASVAEPALKQRLRQHRDETRQHRDTVRDIIVSMQGEPTSFKSVVQPPIAAGLLGKMMSALEREKEDRALADAFADYAMEHYEASLYSALLLIARNLGFPRHAASFEAIRQQERDMADFIAAHLPLLIRSAFPPLEQAA